MFGKKKKKDNANNGRIDSMKVNGQSARCLNMRIFYDENGVGRLEIYTKQPEQTFHFDQCEFEVNTLDNKRLKINADFESATQEKKLYHYCFIIRQIHEYFA